MSDSIAKQADPGVLHQPPPADPFALFGSWMEAAKEAEINDHDAVALASVAADGMPSVRMVLLRQWSDEGFVFFTNYTSRKSDELLATGKAALCLHWKSLRRQIRAVGPIEKASAAVSDAYFASRPRGSQIGAWASDQSQPLGSREDLQEKVAELEKSWEGRPVERPPHWGGFLLRPQEIEFWADGAFRLHDRFRYEKIASGSWQVTRLNP